MARSTETRNGISLRLRVSAAALGDQDGRSDDGGPETADSLGRLGAVEGAHDLAGDLPLLLALVPRRARLVIEAERGGQHGGREVFGVLARLLLGLAVAVVLGEVPVL